MNARSVERQRRITLAKNYILDEIRAGRLKSGDRVPSTLSLCKLLGVTTNNVTDARKQLVQEGILKEVQNKAQDWTLATFVV